MRIVRCGAGRTVCGAAESRTCGVSWRSRRRISAIWRGSRSRAAQYATCRLLATITGRAAPPVTIRECFRCARDTTSCSSARSQSSTLAGADLSSDLASTSRRKCLNTEPDTSPDEPIAWQYLGKWYASWNEFFWARLNVLMPPQPRKQWGKRAATPAPSVDAGAEYRRQLLDARHK